MGDKARDPRVVSCFISHTYLLGMIYVIIYICNNLCNTSLVAVVFKDTALVVNPVFQLHAEAIFIFPRMCSSIN